MGMRVAPLLLCLGAHATDAIDFLALLQRVGRVGSATSEVPRPGKMFVAHEKYLPDFALEDKDDDDNNMSYDDDDLTVDQAALRKRQRQSDSHKWLDGSVALEEERFLNQFFSSDDASMSMPSPTPSPYLQPGVGHNGSPASAFPLGLCEGDCDSNQDCKGHLQCFARPLSVSVPGCRGLRATNQQGNKEDYCYDPFTSSSDDNSPVSKPTPTPSHSPQLKSVGNNGLPRYAYPLSLCEGDCDSDHDCSGNLRCFDNDHSSTVPGCRGNRAINRVGNKEDYCYDPFPASSSSDDSPTYGPPVTSPVYKPVPKPTIRPSSKPSNQPSPVVPTTPQPTRQPSGIIPQPTPRPTPAVTITAMPSIDCLANTTREEFLFEQLSEVTPPALLNDPSSPQGQAFNWIVNVDPLDIDVCTYPTIDQRYGLAVIYFATTGVAWVNSNGWLTNSEECNWFGVDCSGDGENLFAIQLDLEMNNLVGSLPDEILTLVSLQELKLFDNSINSTIPATIGDLLDLSRIDVERNDLTGALFSDEILGLSKLTVLRASFNTLTGSIPEAISRLSLLEQMWIAENDFIGELPTTIGVLQNLETWFIYTNGFSGSIPDQIGNMQSLTQFRAQENFFERSLPDPLFDIVSLQILRLDVNSLSGVISTNIGKLINLRTLRLEFNFLIGSIPAEIGSMTGLEFLLLNDQRSTKLTGSIPDVFDGFTRLEFFDVSNNALTGPIPSSIFSISTIENVYLANNTLTGSLPASYSDPPILRDLFLENNQLTGTIPVIPSGSLDRLNEFLVQGNSFVGTMPDSVCALREDGTGILEDLWADCGGLSPEIVCPFPDCCTRCFIDPSSLSSLNEWVV